MGSGAWEPIEPAAVSGRPPWEPAEPMDYDPGRYGETVPAWADPYADRYTGFGGNSGSNGSDYQPGAHSSESMWMSSPPKTGRKPPAPANHGTGDAGGAAADPRPDPPPPLDLPPGWVQPELPFGPDPDVDERLGRINDAFDVEDARARRRRGRLGRRVRDLITGARLAWLTSRLRLSLLGPSRPGLPADAPPAPPSRLATMFDAELAATVAGWIREQDADARRHVAQLRVWMVTP